MSEIILHHYPESLFSEKVRLILGCKCLSWRSVTIPVVMPKPDLLALTGAYRRTPVMQLGCDIYCDTALISEVLDRMSPEPPLFAPNQAASVQMASRWADTVLFSAVVSYSLQKPEGLAKIFPDPKASEALFADRQPFLSGGSAQVLTSPLEALSVLMNTIDWIDAELVATGARFLAGATPSILDFSVYHCLWFVDGAGLLDEFLAGRQQVSAWMKQVAALGHGRPADMSSAEAIAVARASAPAPAAAIDANSVDGLKPGDAVEVAATDYGVDPTAGTLVTATRREFVIAREDVRAGKVHVHFPRIGFRIAHR